MVFRWKRDDGACKDKRDGEKGNTHTREIWGRATARRLGLTSVCLSGESESERKEKEKSGLQQP